MLLLIRDNLVPTESVSGSKDCLDERHAHLERTPEIPAHNRSAIGGRLKNACRLEVWSKKTIRKSVRLLFKGVPRIPHGLALQRTFRMPTSGWIPGGEFRAVERGLMLEQGLNIPTELENPRRTARHNRIGRNILCHNAACGDDRAAAHYDST